MSNKEQHVDGASESAVKEIRSIAATRDGGYVPPLMTSKLGVDSSQSHALLNDPTLIEDFSDIIKNRPTMGSQQASGNEDSESMGGSVVVTPTSNKSSPFNSKLSILGNAAEKTHAPLRHKDDDDDVEEEVEVEAEKHTHEGSGRGQRHSKENSTELPGSYDYSDSEFEDNLEKRLQDIETDPTDSGDNEEEVEEEQHSVVDDIANHELADMDDFSDGLKYAISEDEDEEGEENYSDDYDFDRKFEDADFEGESGSLDEENDDYQPLPPPRELDPDKLYALYAFNGHDSSHCQLGQDEPCILLNDQDAYWWLVKRITDGKIGFAPAEILETFPERLARLNCWKNENMSSQSVASSTDSKDDSHKNNESDADSMTPTPALKGYGKGNKSVSFNDVVGYADRFIDDAVEEKSSDSDEDGDNEGEKDDDHGDDDDDDAKVRHRDEFTEAKLNFTKFEDDDMSDVVSDVSFSTSLNTPLNVKKVRRANNKNDVLLKPVSSLVMPLSSSNEDKDGLNANQDVKDEKSKITDGEFDTDLKKVFEAPRMPFTNGMAKSDSQNSLSTIGEFSPSSSEWTNDSPSAPAVVEEISGIPSSRAIKDISQYIHPSLKIQESSNNENVQDQAQDKTQDKPTPEATGEKNPQAEVEQPKEDTEKQSSVSLHSSSEEDFYMDEQRVISSASVNSSFSGLRVPSNTNVSDPTSKPHSLVQHLYAPVFDRMDVLMKQLDDIIRK
ncbi:hypothetical protein SEUBUCD646_0A00830 [Saccharomyces eubayanus]|uniref:SH3 domain-containing protein n=1 Tax=Saccharomyces eubayanus TaxID=1080349 RepID=A0ABN8VQF0_SACEU|nr:hypothetical protein SEUBUCD650_0A00820 [Saccharomyces eubayanus]CAI1833559.1 hypothetical protein SEUBUCD646_0A00830 [Saccharomyces eubayanus]